FGAVPLRPAVARATRLAVRANAKGDSADVGPLGLAAIGLGLPANAIMLWSEYSLKTTGAGLPEGPGGALGAA
ncbi:hypothetical protein TSOC_015093, partial [Tetrabaena socialis]